jgi:hypothetical protein
MPRLLFLCGLLLAGCQKPENISTGLPDYSDMGAAADAGQTPSH